MFLQKTKSTPILKISPILINGNEWLNQNIDHLQIMIDDMIKEYQYMDRPLKFPRQHELSSKNLTTDNSIFINQLNN